MKVWLTILLTLMLVSSGRAGSFRGFKKFKNRRNNHKDLRYITTPGVAKKYQTLDWYQPKKNSGRGAIVYIHGGGWHTGDKKNHMDDKVRYFRDDITFKCNCYSITIAISPFLTCRSTAFSHILRVPSGNHL